MDQEEVTVLAMSAPGLGSPAATSAPGLGPPLRHLHRDWAHPGHICPRTGLTPATSAPQVREREYQADHNSLYTRKRTMDGQVYWKSEDTTRARLSVHTHARARACLMYSGPNGLSHFTLSWSDEFRRPPSCRASYSRPSSRVGTR
jgi:hypothetical protein